MKDYSVTSLDKDTDIPENLLSLQMVTEPTDLPTETLASMIAHMSKPWVMLSNQEMLTLIYYYNSSSRTVMIMLKPQELPMLLKPHKLLMLLNTNTRAFQYKFLFNGTF